MNHTENPKALQSQTWILQALLDLMQENSYNKISVSEICRKAGLDRRTFYRNFNSKQDVLEHYVELLKREYIMQFHKIDHPDKYSATLMFFHFWENHMPFIRDMKNCGLSSFVFDQFTKFSEAQQELFSDMVSDKKADYILAFRIGGFWNVILTWAADPANVSPKELAAIITQM